MRHWLGWLALSTVVCAACTSLGGLTSDNPDAAAPDASSDTSPDGVIDDSGASDGSTLDREDEDASCDGSWCSCHPHLLCDDFDTEGAFPAAVWDSNTMGGTITRLTGTLSSSPPHAARFVLPVQDTGSGFAFLDQTLPASFTSFGCGFDVIIRKLSGPASQGRLFQFNITTPEYPSYTGSFSVGNGTETLSIVGLLEGGVDLQHLAMPDPTINAWHHYTFAITSAGHLVVTRDGVGEVDAVVPQLTSAATQVRIFFGVVSAFTSNSEWDVAFDDVFCDLK